MELYIHDSPERLTIVKEEFYVDNFLDSVDPTLLIGPVTFAAKELIQDA